MVYYLKYRPQSLDELIGQPQVVETLRKSLEHNKLSHAYLFVGPRGVGKTSTARILAKMVNCEKGGCNQCEICKSITDGSNLDLIEIDAASNRGIDDIRELREKIKLSPTSLKKKVYIIDEVHMLTTEAFNALLKTLEEPPQHVLFILATTEVQKIPQTILSRVTRLNFNAANGEGLKVAFKKIAEKEKLSIEEEALNLLVKKSEGSFRDGVKLLDQLSAISNKITVEMVTDSLKGVKLDVVISIATLLAQDNQREAIEKVHKEIGNGVSVKDLFYCLMDFFRSMLLIKLGVEGEEKSGLEENFSQERIIKTLESLQKGVENLKFASIQILPLEIALIESCTSSRVIPNASEGSHVQGTAVSQNVNTQQPEIVQVVEVATTIQDDNTSSPDLLTLKDKWSYILEMVKPYNFSLEALLKQVKLGEIEGGVLTLKVPYSFHQRILETPRNRDLLESVLTDVLSKPTKISTVLESRPVRIEELANIEVAADDEVIRVAAEIFNS